MTMGIIHNGQGYTTGEANPRPVRISIQMKLGVFEYYHNFYKHVLDEEEYEKNRLQLYRFLVDAASDGLVGIPLLPGTKKLGDERAGVSATALAGGPLAAWFFLDRWGLLAAPLSKEVGRGAAGNIQSERGIRRQPAQK